MAQEAAPSSDVAEAKGCAERIRLFITIAVIAYVFLGIITMAVFAFFGGARVGAHALTQPRSYVVCMFWPVALVQYLFMLLGLS